MKELLKTMILIFFEINVTLKLLKLFQTKF